MQKLVKIFGIYSNHIAFRVFSSIIFSFNEAKILSIAPLRVTFLTKLKGKRTTLKFGKLCGLSISLLSFFLLPNLSWAKADSSVVVRMNKKELKAEIDTIKARKITYKEFKDFYSIDDTTETILNIFFDKQSNSAVGQMSFFPIAVALVIIPPPIRVIGMGLTIIAFPIFLNGAYTMYKFRKKKLLKVLIEYKKTGYLPGWVRKKAVNQLDYTESLKVDY